MAEPKFIPGPWGTDLKHMVGEMSSLIQQTNFCEECNDDCNYNCSWWKIKELAEKMKECFTRHWI